MSAQNREIALAYLNAWNNGGIAAGRKFVADNYSFKGSIDEFHSADEAFAAFEQLAPMVEGVDVSSVIAEGDDVAMFYVFKVIPPIGPVRIAERLKFQNSKIVDSRIFYDPRTFGNLMPLPPVVKEI
jgi:hypothetical protein